MLTAVDSSALIAIYLGEPDAGAWVDLLADARSGGGLCICSIVAAEFYAVVRNRAGFDNCLHDLGIEITPTSRDAACHAGGIFRRSRDRGGPREHLIPDFLVASHALIDCARLAAADRGYFRRHFPELRVIRPLP
jgi:predicted nucleic acid-binding protein